MSKLKVDYEHILEFCRDNNCKLITSKLEYNNETGRKIISIISSCNHESPNVRVNELMVKGKYIICNKCVKLKESNRFNELIELCKSKNCKIVTTEEEFNDMVRKDKIEILSSCGHISANVNISDFKNRNQYVICKECQSKNKKKFNNNNESFNSMQIEADSIDIIKNNIKNIILEKTVDGCKADLIIKPLNNNKNEWLPIQIKSTVNKRQTGYYNFMIHKNKYENMIIILIAITDKKIWIMDSELVNGKDSIGLGGIKSIYNNYEVKIDDLDNKLTEYYNKYTNYHITNECANMPTSKSQQQEHQFRLLRQTKLNYLTFIEPNISNTTYDFTINNYKIQEKVGIYKKDGGYVAKFRKHDGKHNTEIVKTKHGLCRKQKYTCYKKSDNDFYWINLVESKYFFIIPENKMIEKKVIETENGNSSVLYIPEPDNIINKSHWLQNYMYDYEKNNKEKLINLFAIIL